MDRLSSLPPVEERLNKGRVWNGFVCPGCRTVFRVAADFDGREVICPTCQECLKLPEKSQEAPPLVESRPAGSADAPPPDDPLPDDSPVMDEPASTGLPQRRKLAITFGAPLLAATALIWILARNDDEEAPTAANTPVPESAEIAAETDEPAPVEAVPEITAITPPALPEPVEIMTDTPPRAPSDNPPVASAPEPPPMPEAPPAPPLPDPEEGLVAAVPDTPGAALPLPPVDGEDSGEHLLHVVRSGETLGTIARHHHVTVDEIMHVNRMTSDLLHAGQTLRIPVAPKIVEDETPPPAPEPEAPETAENTTPGKNPDPADKPAPQETAEPIKHTVVRGDTLTRLARQYGCETSEIMLLNGLKNDIIRLGEELLIPPPAN